MSWQADGLVRSVDQSGVIHFALTVICAPAL